MKEHERIERARFGVMGAAIMNTGMASKRDGSAWAPWDVFPELQPDQDRDTDGEAILNMFRAMQARQRARMNQETN